MTRTSKYSVGDKVYFGSENNREYTITEISIGYVVMSGLVLGEESVTPAPAKVFELGDLVYIKEYSPYAPGVVCSVDAGITNNTMYYVYDENTSKVLWFKSSSLGPRE